MARRYVACKFCPERIAVNKGNVSAALDRLVKHCEVRHKAETARIREWIDATSPLPPEAFDVEPVLTQPEDDGDL